MTTHNAIFQQHRNEGLALASNHESVDVRRNPDAFAHAYAQACADTAARCAAIVQHPEARKYPDLAIHLACETNMSVEAAIATIRSAVRASATIPNYGPRQGNYGPRTRDAAGGLVLNDAPKAQVQHPKTDFNAIYSKFGLGAGKNAG